MWLERVLTIITIIGSVAGGFVYLETNYASAADLKRLETSIKLDRVKDRIQDLSHKIFELEFKQRQTPKGFSALDAALLERYKNEMADLEARARDLDK